MSTPTSSTRVKGVYAHLDALLAGIEKLKADGLTGFQVLSPLPRHEILEAVYGGRPSPVRWWTLVGAVCGITIGFLLTSLTAIQWPMINPGGKPNVFLPAYAVIMFESTILFGGLATFVGLIVHCGLPGFWLDKSLKDPRVTDDKFGIVFVRADASDEARITAVLRDTGAVEITTGDDTIYEVANA